MNLRDYQITGIDEIRSRFTGGARRVCYTAPCGSGKTVLMSHMATEAARRGTRSLWLAHRREIINQSIESVHEHPLITIASVQTVARRLDRIPEPGLIIVDECHHVLANTWRQIIDRFPSAYVVGLTATPARLSSAGLGDVFESLVLGPDARDLIRQGYLTPYRYYAPTTVDTEGVKIRMGDFDEKEIEIRVNKPTVIGDCVAHYTRLSPGKQGIVYCASVAHSKNVADAFNGAGINARHVDGTTPADIRERTMRDFRAGEIQVLTNMDLFGEGVDVPAMETVILLRPTASLTVFIQQSMRGMRPDRKNIFKESIILDHVGNVHRHGLPDAPREWTLEGATRRKNSPGGVGIRNCPMCFGVYAPAPVCPYCGYAKEMNPRMLAEEAGTLKEFDAAEAEKAARRSRMEVGMARTMDDLKRIAQDRGYNPGWVWNMARAKKIRS